MRRERVANEDALRFEIFIPPHGVTDEILKEMARLMNCLRNPKRPVILMQHE
jgi:nicotinamidase-related amidase